MQKTKSKVIQLRITPDQHKFVKENFENFSKEARKIIIRKMRASKEYQNI